MAFRGSSSRRKYFLLAVSGGSLIVNLLEAPCSFEIPSFERPGYTRAEWWKTEAGLIAFQNEIMKYLYYRLKY